MSQENVEIVRRGFEEFRAGLASGDPGAMFDSGLLAPDFEWIYELENGLVIRARNFLDPNEALEAAGLRE